MDERRRSAVLAGYAGDVDVARALLGDEDGTVRAAAWGALDRLGALEHDAIAAALDDPDPDVRRRVIELAATRPGIDLSGPLADDDPTVVELAAWAAGEQERVSPAVLERLITLATGADDAMVRESAIAALGAIGDEAGLGAVIAGLDDRATVRRRAVIALAAFEGDDADDALRRALEDRDWQVRQIAEDLLGVVDLPADYYGEDGIADDEAPGGDTDSAADGPRGAAGGDADLSG
ncbi:MAG: HEAT repeat domain-containing protein [Actinomycetota bacterium]|nr:HEAT repeat domain-containing protein [Actinomycetota bacterium]